jgi:peptidoglycan/LPS O-acetylase OafA/YrhL
MALSRRSVNEVAGQSSRLDAPEEGAPDDRFLSSGDESGTAPGDRRFRPDVEGLRAVAVIVVVLFHVCVTAGSGAFSGGYLGVDVFFVISGYVITGLLLRELGADGRINLVNFYAHRVRRIIPAMALVIVASLVIEHWLLGSASTFVSDDAKWSSVFLANVHFMHVYPTFLVHRPGSPLQNYWSLAVEEQYYLVYPIIVLVVALGVRRWAIRGKLAVVLVALAAASFGYFLTATTFVALQYSLPARAWELAIGGIVAVGSEQVRRIPDWAAALMTWVGLAGILVAALCFRLTSSDSGLVAFVPTASAALLIAGGTAATRGGAETILRLAPFRWIGRWSYSFYLWHWPILIFAAQHWGRPTVWSNLGWAAVALAAAAATYFCVENPIRHSAFLRHSSAISLTGGAALIGLCLLLAALYAS